MLNNSKTKQYIFIRKDLNMPVGKVAAQAAHASVLALLNAADVWVEEGVVEGFKLDYGNPVLKNWLEGEFTKVCLEVNSLEELEEVFKIAEKNNLSKSFIIDKGYTCFNEIPTPTAVGVGPAEVSVIEPLFKNFKLYK